MLTKDESYGFTDDMSLIAIVPPNMTIKLQDDANWLCACGNRNKIESTKCERCNKDLFRVYNDVDFRQDGGTILSYFRRLNEDSKHEIKILQEHSIYPIEFYTDQSDSFQQQDEGDMSIMSDIDNDMDEQTQLNVCEYSSSEHIDDACGPILKQQILQEELEKNTTNDVFCHKEIDENKQKISLSRKNKRRLKKIFRLFKKYFGSTISYIFTKIIIKSKKLANNENGKLIHDKENSVLDSIIRILNKKISILKNSQLMEKQILNNIEYYLYDNGDIYIEQLCNGIPNGIGCTYSSGLLIIGCFHHGQKNGEYLSIFEDGHSELCNYVKGKGICYGN